MDGTHPTGRPTHQPPLSLPLFPRCRPEPRRVQRRSLAAVCACRPRVLSKLPPPSHLVPLPGAPIFFISTCQAAHRLRGRRSPPPPLRFSSTHDRLASLQRAQELPLLPTPLGRSEHRRPSPLNEFSRRATVSPVFGEGRRPARVHPPFSVQLAPHLTLPLTDLQGRRWIALALVCRPLPSEHRCAGLSLPPHRRPTSSVSCAVIPLARCTPPTALVPLPSTPQ
jgi:hypothetical protein